MSILNYIILIAIYFATPALVLWLARKWSIIGKIGPIMVLYALGMILGNIPFATEQMAVLQDFLPNILIPLAIPMMLFGCNFAKGEARLQLKLVISGFFSVAAAVALGYLLFGHKVTEGAEIGGIISGMYTGGTLNAAALQAIFAIKSESFILVNSYDIIISFCYFIFLFSFGIRLFRRMYGQQAVLNTEITEAESQDASNHNPYRVLLTSEGIKQLLKTVGITLIVAAASGGVAILMPEGWFMVVFILLLTTLGVVCSFIKPIKALTVSYDLGIYLIYIFSMVIASMADFSNLNIAGGINQFAFMTVAVFVSLTLHALLCRVMKVDADAMVISSVAFINSPPFVPMAAAAMRNKEVIVTGLSVGVVGYAIGNHFGVLMCWLLGLLS
ncbi:MAG: DUF819 family protein [Rikenellaceae bacterium]|nr:DUF819 family protein [Rikenellaceae bacterium]